MRRSVSLALALLSILSVRGTGPAAFQGRVLSGHIVADDSGTPLPNVKVAVASSGDEEAVVLTNREGQFELRLPADRPRIVVSKTGYSRETVSVPVSSDVLEIRLRRAAVIAGRVIDQAGEPVVNARVLAEPVATTGDPKQFGPLETVTDDAGEYRFAGFHPGRFVVAVTTVDALAIAQSDRTSAGFSAKSTRTYYPGVPTQADAQAITVGVGEARSVDFMVAATQIGGDRVAIVMGRPISSRIRPNPTRRDTSIIRGRVVSTDGRPIRRAQVRIYDQHDVMPLRATRADGDGRFDFEELPAGSYRVAAAKSGYEAADPSQAVLASAPSFGAGPSLTLASGEIRVGVDIVLSALGTITGHVFDELGEPIEGARVQALRMTFEDGRRWLSPVDVVVPSTDDRGQYRLYGLPAGEYILAATVSLPGYANTFFPGTLDAGQAQIVSAHPSEETSGIDFGFVRSPTARVRGTILDASGAPSTGGSVSIRPAVRSTAVADMPMPARILANGVFEFPFVPEGQWVIVADRGRLGRSHEGEFGSLHFDVSGRELSDLVLRMSAGSTIAGRVRFEADDSVTRPPASEIEISPVPLDRDLAPKSVASADIDDDWSFRLDGITGVRRLQVVRLPSGWALKEIAVNGTEITDRPLSFGRPEQSLIQVDVVLTDRVSEIKGQVEDDHGRLVPGAHVLIVSTDRTRWYAASRYLRSAVSDRDGSFTAAGLPADTYEVLALRQLPAYGDLAWQDPAFLERVIPAGIPVTLADEEKHAIRLRTSPQ